MGWIIYGNPNCTWCNKVFHRSIGTLQMVSLWNLGLDTISLKPFKDHSVYAPNQWDMTLHCNFVSHWVGAYTKWSLAFYMWDPYTCSTSVLQFNYMNYSSYLVIKIKSFYHHIKSLRPSDHICINKLTIIGSDNGLSPGRHQAIVWTNAGLLLIGPLAINFSEILIEI